MKVPSRVALGVVLLLTATVSLATDTTYELLRAPLVKDRLRFRLDPDGKSLQVSRDDSRKWIRLEKNTTFVVRENVDLVFPEFNPLRLTIAAARRSEADPNYAMLVKFAEALPNNGDPAPDLTAATQNMKASALSIERLTGRIGAMPRGAGEADCTVYRQLETHLNGLHQKLHEPVLGIDEVQQWVTKASGAAGLGTVKTEIDDRVAVVQDNIEGAENLDRAVSALAGVTNDPSCDSFQASTLARIYDITRGIVQTLNERRALVGELKALSKSLEPYLNASAWSEDRPNDFIFQQAAGDFETVRLFDVGVTSREFKVDSAKSTLTVTESKSASETIRFRRYQLLVPETALGAIVTDLEYPKYGTAERNGQTVIESAGTEDVPLGGMVALNLVCRCWPDSVVYPALQIGLMTAKEHPGFLLGGGLRFTRPSALSLVGGWIVTWYDDLEGKKVGDPISGTAELERLLDRRRAPAAMYFGVQYNF